MLRGKRVGASRQSLRVAGIFVLGMLTAGCFQPLYGSRSLPAGDSVRDKFATVQVPPIPAPRGSSNVRLAVELRNELMYALSSGVEPPAPEYRLSITLASGVSNVIVDVSSGRPETQVESVNAYFTLTEIATKKVVLDASTFARASFDTPGSAQRFAQQRAWHDAQDRAIKAIAENIRNRLASYFVAGT